MSEFFKTQAGRIYYGKHVPALITELRKIADNLEKNNKLYESSLKIEKKSKLKGLNETKVKPSDV